MKKLINEAADYVDQSLAGMFEVHPGCFQRLGVSGRVVARREPKMPGKVGLVSGGGFGHLPLFAGYVGEGLLDSCAVGDVFAGPALDIVVETMQVADRGAGILAVIGNYGGDRMAFEMAAEALQARGTEVRIVLVKDDVASAEPAERDRRRGVAGTVFAFKIAGAAAERGMTLAEVASLANRAAAQCRTIGIALSPCTVPARGEPTFLLGPDTVEMGMGIHGEQGVWRGQLRSADTLVDEMLDRLLAETELMPGGRVAILCNSLGATPIEELFILYRRIAGRFSTMGITIARPLVGHFATSMEMAGASISILTLDPEMEQLLNSAARCPFWTGAQ